MFNCDVEKFACCKTDSIRKGEHDVKTMKTYYALTDGKWIKAFVCDTHFKNHINYGWQDMNLIMNVQYCLRQIKENNLTLAQVNDHCQGDNIMSYLPYSENGTFSDFGQKDIKDHKYCYTKCWNSKRENLICDDKVKLSYFLGMIGAQFGSALTLDQFQKIIDRGIEIAKLLDI